MAYRLRIPRKPKAELRRAAVEQLERALAEIVDDRLGADGTIHQVRKRLKKVRGALRLARPASYSADNAFFRDAARGLSTLRDQTALLGALDDLAHSDPLEDEATALGKARARFEERKLEGEAPDAALAALEPKLRAGIERVRAWKISGAGFDAVEEGLERTYRRGRRALRKAYKSGSAEDFHELRKRVKYHGMHLRLLQDSWPPVLEKRRSEAKRLGDLLGDDHDLSVLRSRLQALPGDADEWTPLERLLERRSAVLRRRARALGERLFLESKSDFSERMRGLWEIANAAA